MRSVRFSVLVAAALFLVLCLFATPKRYYCSGTVAGTTVSIAPVWYNPGKRLPPAIQSPATPRLRYEFLGIDAATLFFELLLSVAVGAALWASCREKPERVDSEAMFREVEHRRSIGDFVRSAGAGLQRAIVGWRWRMAARRQEQVARAQAARSADSAVEELPEDDVEESDPDVEQVTLTAAELMREDTYEQFTERMERLLKDDAIGGFPVGPVEPEVEEDADRVSGSSS